MRERLFSITPHHLIKIVDHYTSGADIEFDIETTNKGRWIAERAIELLETVRESPSTKIKIVISPKKDYLCSGRWRDQKCLGIINPQLLGCFSSEKELKEGEIAQDMGIKFRRQYSFSELVHLRELTSFRKE